MVEAASRGMDPAFFSVYREVPIGHVFVVERLLRQPQRRRAR